MLPMSSLLYAVNWFLYDKTKDSTTNFLNYVIMKLSLHSSKKQHNKIIIHSTIKLFMTAVNY